MGSICQKRPIYLEKEPEKRRTDSLWPLRASASKLPPSDGTYISKEAHIYQKSPRKEIQKRDIEKRRADFL